MSRTVPILFVILVFPQLVLAATAPQLLNYQGVLKGSADQPLTGTYDMTFRFYDASSGGALLLTDAHSGAGAVAVAGGLFNATLGAGALAAGSEPDLARVFANHASVWMEIQVGTEVLSPRVRVVSEAYAENAHTLDGSDSSAFSASGHVQAASAGGTGLNTSGAAAGTLLVTSGLGTWATLGPGSPGQLLRSMGSTLQWATPGQYTTDDGDWKIDGSYMYPFVGANVGIGSHTPQSKLGVRGSVAIGESYSQTVLAPDDGLAVEGAVCIGTAIPDGRLHVVGPLCVDDRSDSLDAQQNSSNGVVGTYNFWQSFTAGTSGLLTRVELGACSPLSTQDQVAATLRIYSGEGTGGALRSTDEILLQGHSYTWHNFSLMNPVSVTAGNKYTFLVSISAFDVAAFEQFWGATGSGGPYPGGRSSGGADNDAKFRTFIGTGTVRRVLTAGPGGNVGIGTGEPGYQLQLTRDSAAKPATNTWTIASDARLKKDIAPFRDGLDVIERINPITYRYNGLAGTPENLSAIGVVAQEIRRVAPYTVGTFQAKLDARSEGKTELLDFNSHALTFVLINAVKELDQRTKSLAGGNAATPPKNGGGSSPIPVGPEGTANADERRGPAARMNADADAAPGAPLPVADGPVRFPVCESVDVGDVLVIDSTRAGVYCLGRSIADPGVFGIVTGAASPVSGEGEFQVPVATGGVVYCKADAAYGPIRASDLLCTSPTPGHAMKSPSREPGTILGKALEPLDSGTGVIRVLVMLR